MANIRTLRKKIKSTVNTRKITSAMKLVSAAKLAKAQLNILSTRPYVEELEKTVKTISALCKDYENDFLKIKKNNNRAVLLVVSSNKGLCGSFNNALGKMVKLFIKDNKDKEIKLFFIGKKVFEILKKEYEVGKLFTFNKEDPTIDEVREVANELADLFTSDEVGSIHVAYNKFFSAINTQPMIQNLLPMQVSNEEKDKLESDFPFDFKYDPSPEQIMDKLVPEVYVTSIFTNILDSIASEHGARMTAMENATKNSQEMISKLTIIMNKARQAAITTELIEVVSGAESLKG